MQLNWGRSYHNFIIKYLYADATLELAAIVIQVQQEIHVELMEF